MTLILEESGKKTADHALLAVNAAQVATESAIRGMFNPPEEMGVGSIQTVTELLALLTFTERREKQSFRLPDVKSSSGID